MKEDILVELRRSGKRSDPMNGNPMSVNTPMALEMSKRMATGKEKEKKKKKRQKKHWSFLDWILGR